MHKEKILLIDGMALLFRGFFATSVYGNYMYNNQGRPTNGVHGFVKHFMAALDRFQPTHVICCWDTGSHTFRTTLYPDYKGNRPEPPEELIPQFDMAKDAVTAFDVPNIGIENFEADDCMGTLADQLAPASQVVILTGDQDMLQLIEENVAVAIMKKGRGSYQVFDETNLYELIGCTPRQIIDRKGLMGDTSDNYPGVKGIGEKTSLKLLQEYHSIDFILEQLETLPPGVRKKIETNLEMLHLSRKLAKIRTDVPIEYTMNEARWTPVLEKASETLQEMGIDVSVQPLKQINEESG